MPCLRHGKNIETSVVEHFMDGACFVRQRPRVQPADTPRRCLHVLFVYVIDLLHHMLEALNLTSDTSFNFLLSCNFCEWYTLLLYFSETVSFVYIFYYFLLYFLLLACYVPNVAKRSIWEQCKKKYILRTDRPLVWPILGKFQVAISPRGVVRSTSCLARPPSWKIQMAISPWQIVRFMPCLVLGWDFRGRRIEWR